MRLTAAMIKHLRHRLLKRIYPLAFDLEPDLHRRLESVYLAFLKYTSERDDFEPLHLLDSLTRFSNSVSDSFRKALRRLTYYLNYFPNQTRSPPATIVS
jgi:hypothetical protein